MTEIATQVGLADNVFWELVGPDGQVKSVGSTHNLLTQYGEQEWGERAAGIATIAAATGMVLGTGGATPPAKTGAGAAVVTLLSGSYHALDATYPQSSLSGSSRRITYRCTYVAGEGTSATALSEALLVNTSGYTSGTTNVIARAVISPGAKGALDSLTVTWYADTLAA